MSFINKIKNWNRLIHFIKRGREAGDSQFVILTTLNKIIVIEKLDTKKGEVLSLKYE